MNRKTENCKDLDSLLEYNGPVMQFEFMLADFLESNNYCDREYIENARTLEGKNAYELSKEEICTALTVCVRADRFCEGFLDDCIDRGIIHKLLLRLKEIDENEPCENKDFLSASLGLLTGDALGVPAEFCSRDSLRMNPVTDMTGNGSHQQPEGTWSDDSSMALCLMDSIAECGEINPDDIMQKFSAWIHKGEYSPFGICFDVGNTCAKAISKFGNGIPAAECGGKGEYSNGNGSLMRILPMLFYLAKKYGLDFSSSKEAMGDIDTVSSLTHGHPLSVAACGIYLCIGAELLKGKGVSESIQSGYDNAAAFYSTHEKYKAAMPRWNRIANAESLKELPENEIRSSGFVVDTLEASLWCLLNTDNFKDCALKAVNLGSDTDTTAAVAGGLAGLAYGMESIPQSWLKKLKGKNVFEPIITKFQKYLGKKLKY